MVSGLRLANTSAKPRYTANGRAGAAGREKSDPAIKRVLSTQAQTFDEILVAGGIFSVQVIEQLAALIDHSQ